MRKLWRWIRNLFRRRRPKDHPDSQPFIEVEAEEVLPSPPPTPPPPPPPAPRTDLPLPVELAWLDQLIRYRITQALHPNPGHHAPPMPPYENWQLKIRNYIQECIAGKEPLSQDEVQVLLLSLVHHVQPDLFSHSIATTIEENDTEFTAIGGIKGRNFRGFIPTGQTAIFLFAGEDWQRSLDMQQLFWPDHRFVLRKILWLDDVEPGEPSISGRLILSQDYIDKLAHDKEVAPRHSTQFPAEPISTPRERKELVVSEKVNAEFDHMLEWFQHRELIGTEWKNRKKGYRCLFYGPSGTGKTFMSCLLGKEAKKEVYRIDLSLIISKYIGETEKNLELIFTRAEHKDWILFFDEADALFGKRTHIRDAHDKYANQEVSYLLQRIEQYDGLVILATNMKNNIDDAFRRRFEVEVEFTMPDSVQRAKIWDISFPEKTCFYKKKAQAAAPPADNTAPALETVPPPHPEPGKPVYYHYHRKYLQARNVIPAAADAAADKSTTTAAQTFEPIQKSDILQKVKGYRLSGASIENIVHYSMIRAGNRRNDDKPSIYWEDIETGINRELKKNGMPIK